MKKRGVKLIDPVSDTLQVDWLVVPAEHCPDENSVARLVHHHFRQPHEPWGANRAYVREVVVRRTRRRVLLLQYSGLEL